jgi:OOP family OmpA-OmpF porin
VYFDFDSDRPGEAARAAAERAAAAFREHRDAWVEVDGYADSRGDDDYNDRLSSRRARAVAALLESVGIPAARITVRAHGTQRRASADDRPATWAEERRVEITVRSRTS